MYQNLNNGQEGPPPQVNGGFPPYGGGNAPFMHPIPPGNFQNRPDQIYQNPYNGMPPPNSSPN